MRCVQQVFENQPIGFFCFPVPAGDDGCDGRGFVARTTSATIDSPSALVCLLRPTTCPAFTNYRDGAPCNDGDDGDACGQGGECVLIPGTADFACTIPCDGTADCLSGICLDDLCTL
jgi:hypothetical protein